MDDIVERPRQEWEYGNNAKGCDYEMFAHAADEIERLREMCDQFAESAKMFGTQWGSEVVDFRINEKKLKRAWLKYGEMRNG